MTLCLNALSPIAGARGLQRIAIGNRSRDDVQRQDGVSQDENQAEDGLEPRSRHAD